MTTAHEELTQIYGTADVMQKLALGGGLFGALAGAAVGHSQWEQQAENKRQAAQLSAEIRMMLARRNAPIHEGFRSGALIQSQVPYESGSGLEYPGGIPVDMIHLASAIGADLAMYKEAGIGNLPGAVGGAISKGLGSIASFASKVPAIKGMAGLGKGVASGTGNLMSGIGRGLKAAPGAMLSGAGAGIKNTMGKLETGYDAAKAFGQNKLQQAGTGIKNTMGKLETGYDNAASGLKRRSLSNQYGLQRAGQKAEDSLSRLGGRIEGGLVGKPAAYQGSTVVISPEARRARIQTLQRARGTTPSQVAAQAQAPAAPPTSGTAPAAAAPQTPATTNPAPANQAPPPAAPQAPAPNPTAPAPKTTAPQTQPQAQATPQQPAPPPQPSSPPATGPAAQGAPAAGAIANAPAPPPPPPTTPVQGQGKPAQAPEPVAQATPQNATASTTQAGMTGPSVSPQEVAQAGGWQDKLRAGWDRTGMSNDRWKYKVPALAAAGLGAYGLYRAGQGAFNWLGQEAAPSQWGNAGLQPAASVNEFGQAQR